MTLPIRLKMQKRTGKQTPTLLTTIDQEWEVLYSLIQNKRWRWNHHLHLFAFWCCSTTFFASSSVQYNLLSRTHVPEVPQLPSENRIKSTSITYYSSFLDKDRRGYKVNNISFIKSFFHLFVYNHHLIDFFLIFFINIIKYYLRLLINKQFFY